MAANPKPTLETIVTRYRREASRGGSSSPELEIRLQEVDYDNFAAIYRGLTEDRPAQLTQMVGAIMDIRRGRGEGPQSLHQRPMRIREIYFSDGKRLKQRFVYKEPLVIPYRVPSNVGLSYIVALSAERADDQGFTSDEGAVIRVKARVSVPITIVGAAELKPKLDWRVDMTITRQIMGSDADSALKQIVSQMFQTKPNMTPQTLLKSLHLDDDMNPAARQLYRYEVEAEFVGSEDVRDMIRPADVTAAAEAILRLANPEYVREAAMQAEVFRVAKYIVDAPGLLRRFQHELGLKRLLPQALAITRAIYRGFFPPRGYYLTDKADGKRALGIVHDGRGAIVSDSYSEYSPKGKATPRLAPDTVVDGELVGETLYVFDAIIVAGEDVSKDGFEKRLARIDEAVAILTEAGVPAAAKPYAHIVDTSPAQLEKVIRAAYEAKRPYDMDGLIFVEPGKSYVETANNKWKPAEHNTIDFLARRAPSSVVGKEPFVARAGCKLYFLFVGINPDLYEALGLRWCPGYADLFGAGDTSGGAGNYFPVQFAPSDAPLAYIYHHPDSSPQGDIDGKIVEARCTGGCAAAGGGASAAVDWEIVRVRDDRRRELLTKRYFGNDFYTAEVIWLNYVDPFPIEQLWDGPGLDYFMREKSGAYRAQTAVISYAKTRRIAELKHANCVIDFAAGKGQDLGRYFDAEVRSLVAVDQDRAALSELVRRKYSFARRADARAAVGDDRDRDERGRRGRHRAATTVHVLVADLAAPFSQTLDKLEALGIHRMTSDAVVCNLAVHYFLANVETLRNFVALVRGAVKVGGRVIITALIGEAVHALFAAEKVKEGQAWSHTEGDTVKYSLKRLYSSGTLEATGQRIGVLLPFSDGEYYEEYLVNTKSLAKEFADRGFRLSSSTTMQSVIPEFEDRNRPIASLLTAGDRKYLGLYGELCFVRDK